MKLQAVDASFCQQRAGFPGPLCLDCACQCLPVLAKIQLPNTRMAYIPSNCRNILYDAAQGLAAFGIDKATLLSAGLTEEAVALLYRALYVHTIGFQDKAKQLVGPLEHKHVPLNNIWHAYLAIAETAMKVGFKVSMGTTCD